MIHFVGLFGVEVLKFTKVCPVKLIGLCIRVSHTGVYPKAESTKVLRDEIPRKITELSPFRPKRIDWSWNRTCSQSGKPRASSDTFWSPTN
ncbi:hypothetical protein PCAR4_570170 [Paraburkholderia caribensis]|nr:hypothetical protein PCAR4_570170 [Paraburkholderia caribensis]